MAAAFAAEELAPGHPGLAALLAGAAVALNEVEVVEADAAADRDAEVGPDADEDGDDAEENTADDGGHEALGQREGAGDRRRRVAFHETAAARLSWVGLVGGLTSGERVDC